MEKVNAHIYRERLLWMLPHVYVYEPSRRNESQNRSLYKNIVILFTTVEDYKPSNYTSVLQGVNMMMD